MHFYILNKITVYKQQGEVVIYLHWQTINSKPTSEYITGIISSIEIIYFTTFRAMTYAACVTWQRCFQHGNAAPSVVDNRLA